MTEFTSNPAPSPEGDVIAEYLAGRSTGGDRAAVEAWIAGDPEAKSELEMLRRVQRIGSAPNVSGNAEHFLTRMREVSGEPKEPFSNKSLPRWIAYSTVAVTVAIVLVFATVTDVAGLTKLFKSSPNTHTYVTKPGQRATITILTGTQVVLAPATTLQVTENIVTLSGQALFTVKHNSANPLIVRIANANVRVLGTTFSVRAYEGSEPSRVIVAEGKVDVAGNGSNIILSSGDAARITSAGSVFPITDINLAEALGWAQGKLVFERVKFKDVLVELERAYNIKFVALSDTLADREVIGILSADNLTAALDALSSLLDASYRRNGNTITFYPNRPL